MKVFRILFCNIFCMAFIALQTASATIVYSGVQDLPLCGHDRSVEVDMDGGGIVDFLFKYNIEYGSEYGIDYNIEDLVRQFRIDARPGDSSNYFMAMCFGPCGCLPPTNFSAGEEIGEPDGPLDERGSWSPQSEGTLAVRWGGLSGGRFRGNLDDGLAEYIGVKFYHQGDWLYGWIGFGTDNEVTYGLVNAWAYEDVPGQPILAGAVPEPATIVMLGLGGLALFRKRF